VAVRRPVLGVGAGAGTMDGVGEFTPGLALDFDIPGGEEGHCATADNRHCSG
jgi:hypothetical protein